MRLILATALLAATAAASAQQLAPDTAAKVAAIAQKVLADSGVPSASTASSSPTAPRSWSPSTSNPPAKSSSFWS